MKNKIFLLESVEFAEYCVIPAKAGIQRLFASTALRHLIPAYAGMTNLNNVDAYLFVLCASALKLFQFFTLYFL